MTVQSYCERCEQPRRIVGGRVTATVTGKPSADGELIVETVRRVVEGTCETCGAQLRRPLAVRV